MKLIIAGGRDFTNEKYHSERVCARHRDFGIRRLLDLMPGMYSEWRWTEIVSGKAPGADRFGEGFAQLASLPVKGFPADWEQYKKAAGAIRNNEMANYADVLVAFWDGKSRGTKDMIRQALSRGLEVHVLRYEHLNRDET